VGPRCWGPYFSELTLNASHSACINAAASTDSPHISPNLSHQLPLPRIASSIADQDGLRNPLPRPCRPRPSSGRHQRRRRRSAAYRSEGAPLHKAEVRLEGRFAKDEGRSKPVIFSRRLEKLRLTAEVAAAIPEVSPGFAPHHRQAQPAERRAGPQVRGRSTPARSSRRSLRPLGVDFTLGAA